MPMPCTKTRSLSRFHSKASSNASSDSQSRGDRSRCSDEQSTSNATGLTDADDCMPPRARPESDEGQRGSRAQQQQPPESDLGRAASASPDGSARPAASSASHGSASSTERQGSERAEGALPPDARATAPDFRGRAPTADPARNDAKSVDSRPSPCAGRAAPCSGKWGKFPIRFPALRGANPSSNPESTSTAQCSTVGRKTAPAIRHAQRDSRFSLPLATRPEGAPELRDATLRTAGGGGGHIDTASPRTSIADVSLRYQLDRAPNHVNWPLNPQTLLNPGRAFRLPTPATQEEFDALRTLVHAAQQAMAACASYASLPSSGGRRESHDRLPSGRGGAGAADSTRVNGTSSVESQARHFRHHSMPTRRTAKLTDPTTAVAEPDLPYAYRGPLDVACVPGRVQTGGGTVRAGECATGAWQPPEDIFSILDAACGRSLARTIGAAPRDFHVVEVQVVVRGDRRATTTGHSPCRRRRWSVSEGVPLAFRYELAGHGGSAAPPAPSSLAPRPSLPDRSGVETPSIKSTSTDCWNHVYSGQDRAPPDRRGPHESRNVDFKDWARPRSVTPPSAATTWARRFA